MKKVLLLLLLPSYLFAQKVDSYKTILETVQSFSTTSAVTGREEEAANYIQSLFESGICKKDKLGNLIITIGSGNPKRLFTTALDEPGYVVSEILDDGYLRITPVGYGHQGNLFHQYLEGNEIKINTEKGIQFGVSTVPSSHYDRLRAVPEKSKSPFQWQESFIDVGESSAKAVAEKGIHLLDPLTINKKPFIVNNHFIAAPSAGSKSAVIALAAVAKTLLHEKFTGTVIIAFTTLELINGKGLETVANKYGPFDQVIRFNRFLNAPAKENNEVLANQSIPNISAPLKIVKPVLEFNHPSTIAPEWGNAAVYQIGLPSNYIATPVEMVYSSSIVELAQTWLKTIENKTWTIASLKVSPAASNNAVYKSFNKESNTVSDLVSKYGVSKSEQPVRDHILSQLPKWAKPEVDEAGNISISFGKGKQHIAFVGHMDEVGFLVDTIRNDGSLVLKEIGGLFNWVWEGHPALIHTNGMKSIPAIFEPRNNYLQSTKRFNGTIPLTAFAGFHSKEEALAAGIKEGLSSVTMPKKMIRLSENKATARGFDDRAGCAALLLSLENLNPDQLPFKVTIVWSVEEETGLTGSTFASNKLKGIDMVYPIDTYVSSDAPMESKIFGYCPLGKGMVIRVLESINFISRDNLKYLQGLALKNNIITQYGMTSGGTDGQGFLRNGIPSAPLSWPGRYSHSPIEVMDFNDLQNLTKLIRAIMMDEHKKY